MKKNQPGFKAVVIAPTDSQPRYHKRVTQLAKFCKVIVFAFNRGYYNENTFPAEIPFFPLGRIKDGQYIRRIFRMAASVLKIRSYLKNAQNCFFYAMSFDCMIIARLCGLKKGFYEIGDLRNAEGFGKIFSALEKRLLKDMLGLVLTSRFFYDGFYKHKQLIPRQRVFIIDNRINPSLMHKRPLEKHIAQGRIAIGLVGLLRYWRPIELLLDFVKKRPESYVIECFGDGILRELIESSVCEHIRYHGSFRNPEELSDIYARIDLNYVVYDNSTKNVRLAIPNKLFESAFFGVPIICCQGTSVGRTAVEWQIGKTVRIDDQKNFERDLLSVDRALLKHWSRNCLRMQSSDLLDNGEKIVYNMLAANFGSISVDPGRDGLFATKKVK